MRAPGVLASMLCACSFRPGVLAVSDADIELDASIDAAIDARPAPACFGAACRRKTITIDRTKVVAGPHIDFPVLVHITDTDLATNAAASGFDLVFTDATGMTTLAYERARFVGGELIAWVRVPELSSLSDTVIQLYYGDVAAAIDGQNVTGTWNLGFQAVWHLEDLANSNSGSPDSTVANNIATAEGGPMRGVSGHVGLAIRFAPSNHLRVASSASLTSVANAGTLSLWANFDDPSNDVSYQRLLMAENTFNNDMAGMEWATQPTGNLYYYPSDAGGLNYNLVTAPLQNASWHHLAVTHDFATKSAAIYVDGVRRTLADELVPAQWTRLATAADWYWSGKSGGSAFTGVLDEIRVANVVRSDGWIATEHANQRDPATFYSVSATSSQ